jgi:hypothetical protein
MSCQESWQIFFKAKVGKVNSQFCEYLLIPTSGGFVGESEAGQRLFQVAHDPRCAKSGVYWSWNGGPREGRGAEAVEKAGQISGGGGAGGGWDSIFENDQSSKVLNIETAMNLFQYSTKITGAEWPELKQITSPCPTLMVIGAVTGGMVKRQELERMREMGRPGMNAMGEVVVTANESSATPAVPIDETLRAAPIKPAKLSKRKKVVLVADRIVGGILSNTVGRVARFAGKRILGEFPEEAKNGSFHDGGAPPAGIADLESVGLIEQAISEQLSKEVNGKVVDKEDEALFDQLYNGDTGASEEKSQATPAVV